MTDTLLGRLRKFIEDIPPPCSYRMDLLAFVAELEHEHRAQQSALTAAENTISLLSQSDEVHAFLKGLGDYASGRIVSLGDGAPKKP